MRSRSPGRIKKVEIQETEDKHSKKLKKPHWFPQDPIKRWTEIFF
jgi:hypothetical protein